MRKLLILKCLFALLLSSAFVYTTEKCIAEDEDESLPASNYTSATSMPKLQNVMLNIDVDGKKMNDVMVELMPIKSAEEFAELCKGSHSAEALARFSLTVIGQSTFLVDNSTMSEAKSLNESNDKMIMAARPVGKVVGSIGERSSSSKILIEQCWIPTN